MTRKTLCIETHLMKEKEKKKKIVPDACAHGSSHFVKGQIFHCYINLHLPKLDS